MKIFWSWQSDTPATIGRNFVKSALEIAIKQVTRDLDLSEAERAVLDHDTKGVPGLAAIADTIFEKIDSATLFIADISLIGKTDEGKKTPNPNVLIELGYAMKSLGFERLILIANTSNGYKHEDLPFDLRHRRGPITYELSEEADKEAKARVEKRLIADLVHAIGSNIRAIEPATTDQPPPTQHYESNRSLWFDRNEPIILKDGVERRLYPSPALAHLRITPTGWLKEKPPRYNIQSTFLSPFGRWSNAAHMQPNRAGVITAGWVNKKEKEITALTQWFDKTGELWGVASGYAFDHQGRPTLATHALARDLRKALTSWISFFESFEAAKPYTIEAGITGFENTYWPSESSFDLHQCMENEILHSVSSSDWGKEAQLQFLTELFSRICDGFSMPRPTPDQVYSMSV